VYSVLDITTPAAEPVSLELAKQHLRVDDDAEDALIQMWIMAARQYVEKVTRRAIFERDVVMTLDQFPLRWNESLNPIQTNRPIPHVWEHFEIKLPKPRCKAVKSITYQDVDGNPITLDPSTYRVDLNSQPARIVPAPGLCWPYIAVYIPGTIQVTYTAGSYGDGVDVNTCPQTIVAAMLLLIGHWFANREATAEKPPAPIALAVDSLLNTERTQVFGY
jgi:uncharacterized phiE125 gp8 family phage protein